MNTDSLLLTTSIGIIGASGAITRYLIGRFFAEKKMAGWLRDFPLGTFIINISGSFLIGIVFSLAGHKFITATTQAVLATGFLGGYTTFSTASWEQLQLLKGKKYVIGMTYTLGSVGLGLIAVIAGIAIGNIFK